MFAKQTLLCCSRMAILANLKYFSNFTRFIHVRCLTNGYKSNFAHNSDKSELKRLSNFTSVKLLTEIQSNFRTFCKRNFFTASLRQTLKEKDELKFDGESDTNKRDVSSLLETWFYEVSPYGSLDIRLPFKTVIKPLNPQEYPDMNKCIIELYYKPAETKAGELPKPHQLSQISDMYDLSVSFDKDKASMNISCHLIEGVNLPVYCYLHVPLKSDLTVKVVGGESVSVESMESDSINIDADRGNIILKKIKCGCLSAVSWSGNITSKSTLLGNTSLQCWGSGAISTDKLQGSSVCCSTEMGSIDVKSLYTESATFKTVVGNINLGHCHGQICVVGEKSNLCIDSLDGDLDAGIQHGSASVLLSRHNQADIDLNTGDIELSFPEEARTDLTLSSPLVKTVDELGVQFRDTDMPHYREGFIGESGVARVHARTLSGTIHLQVLDWIKTTKLAFMDKQDDS